MTVPNINSQEVYDTLFSECEKREDASGVKELDDLAGVYEGELPSEYDRFFPRNSPKQIVNFTRLAWDDLATQVGRLPDLRADTTNNSDAEEKRAGMLERIGHSYLRNSEPSGKMLMFQVAWWLLAGRAVVLVHPDHDKKTPVMSIRDPRTCYPGPKKTAGNQIVELNDLIFRYKLPVLEMQARGLATKPTTGAYTNPKQEGTVIEYIDENQWIVASDGGTVQKAEHKLGMVPGWIFQNFSPNKTYGLSQFQDQITFMVAISRMLSQKLRFADRLTHPITWIKGHEGTIQIGPDTLNKLSPQGEMGQLMPPVQLQVDRDIELLTRFSRILNRNPEVRQGEIQARGSYTSAKTLEQLSESIDTVVGRMWDVISVGLQQLLAICYMMDEQYWPNLEKPLKGIIKNQKFSTKYIPSQNIGGRWDINVDYGFGVGGYQGFLQQIQAKEAGVNSKRRAMEQMPGVSDVDDLMREIELETMDDAATANFAAQAANGQLDMVLWARLRKQMATKGTPLAEVILKYEEEIRAQAQQALEQGGAEALAPPAPQAAPPGEPPLPGVSPAALFG